MKKLLLALTALSAWAQSSIYIDLSGDWQASNNASLALTKPGFDDRLGQTIQLPSTLPRAVRWLRRTVALPPSTDRTRLVLGLGRLTERFQVYVNEQRIASVGDIDDLSTSRFKRIRTFAIPASAVGSEPRLRIAIRLGEPPAHPFVFNPQDEGPYFVTDRARLEPGAEERDLALWRQRFTLTLVVATIYLILTIPVLLAWLGERRRYDLPLLALLLGVSALYGAHSFFTVSPEATPWTRSGLPAGQQFLRYGTWMLLTSFVLESLKFRLLWLQALLWISWCLLPFQKFANKTWDYYFVMQRLMALVALAAVVVAWTKLVRGRAPWREHVFVLVLAVPVAERVVAILSPLVFGGQLDAATRSSLWNGFYIISGELGVLALSAAVLGVLLWQLALDRREKQRLAGELEAARAVQQLLISVDPPTGHAWTIEAAYLPAQEVGGDFYQLFPAADGSLLLVTGDVSGKGLQAAMLVAAVVGALGGLESRQPAAVLAHLNRSLRGKTRGGFVTCYCARFDATGSVTLANAGHPSPYCDGREVEVEPGLPLGLVAEVSYQEAVVSGDRFTFVSDGVIEAENPQRELFGFDRTREISMQTAQEIANAAKQWGQNDDITVVTVRRNP